MSARAIAYANDSVVFVAWQYPAKIPDCLGFEIIRHDVNTNTATPLPAWVGFQGGTNAQWLPKTTADWPVQKFNWNDFTGEPGHTYFYEIVPMIGQPGGLTPQTASTLQTGHVTLAIDCGNGFSAAFTHGILSTQFLAHALPANAQGEPDSSALIQKISDPNDPLRKQLAGNTTALLKALLEQAAANGGTCYASLYELTDTELIQTLIDGKAYVQLILGNTGTDDAENAPARQQLKSSGVNVYDRMVTSGHIAHNKFVLYADAAGTPQSVVTGSTNWTPQAMCGQSNNVLRIDDPQIAAKYLDYWQRMKADGSAQGPDYRATNAQGTTPNPAAPPNTQVWFSPNTKQKTKPNFNPATPPDLGQVFDLMSNAKEMILFLEFEPGTPSVIDQALKVQQSSPNLFVRGAVSSPQAMPKDDDVQLFHRPGEEPVIVPATAVNDTFAFWQKELLKSSPGAHAIIHDKIVLIDPFTDDCVVITGSHNQGFRASYNNDENLVILRGFKRLAQAYAVHVLDVYDHYRFRYLLSKDPQGAFSGLLTTDAWQDPYFAAGASDETGLWFG